MGIYETIGKSYDNTRKADPRIVNNLVELLDCGKGSMIADIGAGTGNYSAELARLGYLVEAVEPSEAMNAHRKNVEGLTWHKGVAEDIPLDDQSVDGVVCTFSIHHFQLFKEAICEVYRILKPGGRWVIFSQDPANAENDNWFREYFEDLQDIVDKTLLRREVIADTIRDVFNSDAMFRDFLLPDDLVDHFWYSAWKYPEKYCDPSFIKNISIFSYVTKELTADIIDRLSNDLASGKWDARYGDIRLRSKFNGGHYFLSVEKLLAKHYREAEWTIP